MPEQRLRPGVRRLRPGVHWLRPGVHRLRVTAYDRRGRRLMRRTLRVRYLRPRPARAP